MNYLQEALEEAQIGVNNKEGGPFGAVIVSKDGQIIAKDNNQVLKTNDPTAHAEIMAIRQACQILSTTNLKDCTIYSTCEPCPMCLSAIAWANIKTVYYASTRKEASQAGFKDDDIYEFLKGNNTMIKKVKIDDKKADEFLLNYNGNRY